MENNDNPNLLDYLYEISGKNEKNPSDSNYSLVMRSLSHQNDEIRERAIFISGLKWMDRIALNSFIGSLIIKSERSDNNRMLMIECLVAEALLREDRTLESFLKLVISNNNLETLTAKSAFIGLKRLKGQITKAEYATLDYDDVNVNINNL